MKSINLFLILVFSCGLVLSQGDPFPTNPTNQNPPPDNTINKTQKMYKTSKYGIYTFKSEALDFPDYVDVNESNYPAFFFSNGKSINTNLSFNFEAFLHYASFEAEIDHIGTVESKSSSYTGGAGFQAEIRIPISSEVFIPYGQASVGYYHSYIDNSIKGGGDDFSYNYNFGGIYNTIGGGGIFFLSEEFALFGEIGHIWTRTFKTLGDVTRDIYEGQGIDPDYAPLDDPIYDEKIKGNNSFFKIGLVIMNPL